MCYCNDSIRAINCGSEACNKLANIMKEVREAQEDVGIIGGSAMYMAPYLDKIEDIITENSNE